MEGYTEIETTMKQNRPAPLAFFFSILGITLAIHSPSYANWNACNATCGVINSTVDKTEACIKQHTGTKDKPGPCYDSRATGGYPAVASTYQVDQTTYSKNRHFKYPKEINLVSPRK